MLLPVINAIETNLLSQITDDHAGESFECVRIPNGYDENMQSMIDFVRSY